MPVSRSTPRLPNCLQDIPRLEIPLHTLIELTPKPDGKMAEERLKIDIHDPSMQHLLKSQPSDMRPKYNMQMTPFSPLDHLRADPFGSGAMSRKSSGGLSNVSGHASCNAAACHDPEGFAGLSDVNLLEVLHVACQQAGCAQCCCLWSFRDQVA